MQKKRGVQGKFNQNLTFESDMYPCKQNWTKIDKTLKDSKCWILSLDYSNQSGWVCQDL